MTDWADQVARDMVSTRDRRDLDDLGRRSAGSAEESGELPAVVPPAVGSFGGPSRSRTAPSANTSLTARMNEAHEDMPEIPAQALLRRFVLWPGRDDDW
ncbi:MAG TPA: hypothetical protein VFR67_05080 [Pilimelia sp.]|nr:hypothetical protein [Pilimelia sp.]